MAKEQENPVITFSIIVSKETKEQTIDITTQLVENLKNLYQPTELYYIYHTETEHLHSHILVKINKRTRKSTLLKALTLDIETTGIQLQECKNLRNMARYLIHKDNKDKHQYKVEDVVIIQGNYDAYLIDTEDTKLTDKDLWDAFENCNQKDGFNLKQYVQLIGWSNANRFYRLALDLAYETREKKDKRLA